MNAHGLFHFIFLLCITSSHCCVCHNFCCGCLAVNLFASWFDLKVGT